MKFHPFAQRLWLTAQQIPLPFWLGLMIVLPLSAGTLGLWLLSQKEVAECEAARPHTVMADSTRLYCAQMLADRGMADDLLKGIQLANAIAYDHPLRTDADRFIERWSTRLLELGNAEFQAGKLTAAIAIVESIPVGTPAYATVPPQVQSWQAIWQEAEAIHESAMTALEDDKPTVALAEARKLLQVKNQYWSNTRFQDLVIQIQATREERRKQAAQNRQKEPEKSPLPVANSTSDLLNQWEKEQEAEARTHLARARQFAANGSIAGMREAISAAELVFAGTSQYPRAQQLIDEWTSQIEAIEDRPYLDRASQLSGKGDIASLQAAISEANNIYFGRALYPEAQRKIDQWTEQIRQLHEQQYSRPESSLPTNQF